MTIDRTFAISCRVVNQIVRDRRSLALIIVAPIIVMSLVGFSFTGQPNVLNRIAPALIAVFALFFTFLLTGVSFLRERASGTLERMLTTTVGRGDILVGYLLGFLLFAMAQSVTILMFTIFVLQVDYEGALWQAFVVLFLLVIVAVSLGIFVSTFARNELQVVQFIPIVFAPQVFLSGVIVPVEDMPRYLEALAYIFPLTYAVEGLQDIMIYGQNLGDVLKELAILCGFAVGLLVLAVSVGKRTGR